MAEQGQQVQQTSTPDAALNTEALTTPPVHMIPQSRFNEVNEARKALEAKLAEYQKNDEAEKRKREIEDGKFKEVIAELEPKAARADELEKALRQYLDTEIAEIPETMRDLIPSGDIVVQLAWIRQAKTRGLFNPQRAPETDAGARGDVPPKAVKLTALQDEMRRKTGLTIEQYVKHLNEE